MGFIYLGVPAWLINWASVDKTLALSVETGTALGDSADRLARAFGRCITIERDSALAAKARARFFDRPEIEVRQGSSREALPEVVTSLDEPAFFWLDAHWSAGITAGADDPCPLLGELDAIAKSPNPSRNVVAIDDLRLFGFGHNLDPYMEHFPPLFDVLGRLEALGLSTFCVDDVVIGVPAARVRSLLSLGPEIEAAREESTRNNLRTKPLQELAERVKRRLTPNQ